MPREYAKNWFSMWTDEDFCDQPAFDKLLYVVLCGQRSVNNAGVMPINLTRLRKALRNGGRLPSERDVKAALIRLERRRYVFTDVDTGEILIRSHIRRDELDKQPNVLLSALRFLAAFDSVKFAVVMKSELGRIHLPEMKSDKDSAKRLRDLLKRADTDARKHLATLSEGLSEPLPEPFAEDFPEGLPRPAETEPLLEGLSEGLSEPPVVVEVEVASSPSGVNCVGEGPALTNTADLPPASDPNEPPPETCPKHVNNPDAPPCGACGRYKDRRKRWEADKTSRDSKRRKDFWDEVRPATCCDPNGMTDKGRGLTRCPNHDWSLINA